MEIEMCVMECLGQIQLREMGKTVNNRKNLREKLKKFEKLSWKRKTRISRDWIKSPGLAAKTLKDKIVKKILSVFRDWKVYPRGSRELSRENLCVTLATGPFTREQVAKFNTRARG